MAQIFPKWTNRIPLLLSLCAPVVGVFVLAAVWYWGSPKYLDVGYAPRQPVPYSHRLHVGELGLDCRYCHASVEQSPVANIPPTKTCMNCHEIIQRDSELLAPVRESIASGRPMRWVRVHNLPDYAYFNHSIHVHAGVGCASCHGRIDRMEVVYQAKPLSMGWCLDCHRNPAPHIRKAEEVTNMDWVPPRNHAVEAARIVREKRIRPPEDCSGCHR